MHASDAFLVVDKSNASNNAAFLFFSFLIIFNFKNKKLEKTSDIPKLFRAFHASGFLNLNFKIPPGLLPEIRQLEFGQLHYYKFLLQMQEVFFYLFLKKLLMFDRLVFR